MTEDEAKTKACCGPFSGRLPYGSAADGQEIAIQGLDPDYIAETAARWPCIGSACMAWRWGVIVAPGIEATVGVKLDTGFCGLAGAPK